MSGLSEYMSEKKHINRWMVLIIGLVGMFCGAVIAFVFFLSAMVG